VDSTEAISVDEEELTGPSARPAPILRESALTRFLRDKGFELFLSVAAGVLLAVVSWLAVQVYSMNRELGELRVRQERSGQDAEKAQQEAARALEKAEERFQRALDRLETRAAAPQPAAATARP
jgi:Tfp pilus assembly protein PilX